MAVVLIHVKTKDHGVWKLSPFVARIPSRGRTIADNPHVIAFNVATRLRERA